MGLLDDLEFLKKKRKPNLLANVQQLQRPAEPYLRQQYPEVYGGLGGLLGMAPDEMAGSILDPNTARVRAGAEYGFPVGTAAQVAPLAPMLATGAKATARALGPTAVGMGEGYLKRRGLMPELDVYHGSPHKFDRFDASKIGTGEGNQSYGYGLYTAENPEVAETYQKMVNTGPLSKQAKKFVRENIIAGADNDAILKAATSSKNQATRWDLEDVKRGIPASRNDYVSAMDEVQEFLTKNPVSQADGSFYKVDLPDEQIAKMLDYDKHLSEQSPEVQKILMPYQKEIGGSFGTGEQTLKAIAFERRMKGLDDSPAAVSQQLRDMGIPGIKYLDEGSRSNFKIQNTYKGQPYGEPVTFMTEQQASDYAKEQIAKGFGVENIPGTRNFVTFPGEEQSLTILERNGQPMIARPQQQDAAPDLLQYQQMLDEEERKKLGGLLFR